MPVTASNTLFVYREGDADSQAVALYYQSAHGLADSQLLGISCSTDEILDSYATFQTQVESPIQSYITTSQFTPNVIVTGYNVPGGFMDGSDIVSTTSRLMRFGQTYVKHKLNPIYDRKASQRLSVADLTRYTVTGRIDGPTPADCTKLIDAAMRALKQGQANGTFYIDPFPTVFTDCSGAYAADLAYFVQKTLPTLNMASVFSTVEIDPYVDVSIPYVVDDSFVWASGADQSDSSYFHLSSTSRLFFYNADIDGAYSIRDASSKLFPHLALTNGYSTVGGSMSNASSVQYLRPTPFFNSLLAGACVGEAYVFAGPLLDCSETLLGDPLVVFSFPVQTGNPNLYSAANGTALMLYDLQSALAGLYQKQLFATQARDLIMYTDDLLTKTMVFYPAQQLVYDLQNIYVSYCAKLANYITSLVGPAGINTLGSADLLNFLTTNNLKVGQLYVDALAPSGVTVPFDVIYPEGLWWYDAVLQDQDPNNRTFYNFMLNVSLNADGSDPTLTLDSGLDPAGWQYEQEPGVFVTIPSGGVPSNYVGRKIRFTSVTMDQMFQRGNTLYLTFWQYDDNGTYAPVTASLAVFT